LWFGGGVGGARSRKGWHWQRNRKKLRKAEKWIVGNVCAQCPVLHLFLSYGPRAGPFWPAGWPTGLAWAGGLKFVAWPIPFQPGWRAGPSGRTHFAIPKCKVGLATMHLESQYAICLLLCLKRWICLWMIFK